MAAGYGASRNLSPVFPSDSAARRVNAEGVLLLGGGRALLMQLAHPLVAAAVAEHSDFEAHPLRRLWRTLTATYTMVFGSEEQARATAAHLWQIHDTVTGPGYQANDPALLMWVHATLVDTALRVHGHFLRPLSAGEREAYYGDMAQVADLVGIPRQVQPADFEAFREYMRDSVRGLEVSAEARRLARAVLHPPLPWVAWPAATLAREATIGLLPASLRRQYGLSWSPVRSRGLRLTMEVSRAMLTLVPAALRQAPASLLVGRGAGAAVP